MRELFWFSYNSPRVIVVLRGALIASLKSPVSLLTTLTIMSSPIITYSPGFLPNTSTIVPPDLFIVISFQNLRTFLRNLKFKFAGTNSLKACIGVKGLFKLKGVELDSDCALCPNLPSIETVTSYSLRYSDHKPLTLNEP